MLSSLGSSKFYLTPQPSTIWKILDLEIETPKMYKSKTIMPEWATWTDG